MVSPLARQHGTVFPRETHEVWQSTGWPSQPIQRGGSDTAQTSCFSSESSPLRSQQSTPSDSMLSDEDPESETAPVVVSSEEQHIDVANKSGKMIDFIVRTT